ncbi:hypothetical protein RHMOL_Rhmol01G0020300 [Rhododendron molle]|uniref:Uncharacterized protein n=1 Tax=Rhododendron molle TaxID=49168 RepID=A0ACC0PX51_RHOML|nr:hypothetical protein RHMOL_Rhmol01G0020300 [Rhododendron molle]
MPVQQLWWKLELASWLCSGQKRIKGGLKVCIWTDSMEFVKGLVEPSAATTLLCHALLDFVQLCYQFNVV